MFKLAIMALLAAQAAPEPDGAWHCRITQVMRCDPGRACVREAHGAAWILIDSRNERYYSCRSEDFSDCGAYRMVASQRDGYSIYEVPGYGRSVRVGPQLSFTEIATAGESGWVVFGRCEDGPPPITRH